MTPTCSSTLGWSSDRPSQKSPWKRGLSKLVLNISPTNKNEKHFMLKLIPVCSTQSNISSCPWIWQLYETEIENYNEDSRVLVHFVVSDVRVNKHEPKLTKFLLFCKRILKLHSSEFYLSSQTIARNSPKGIPSWLLYGRTWRQKRWLLCRSLIWHKFTKMQRHSSKAQKLQLFATKISNQISLNTQYVVLITRSFSGPKCWSNNIIIRGPSSQAI